ncbi:MAG: cytochrome oxidase small assembly protein [Burkholderiaceae bacterium]
MTPDEKKTKNLKTALILASVALVFFVGFMAKMIFLSR